MPDKVVFDDAFAIGQRVAILDVNCKNKDDKSKIEKDLLLINISTQREYLIAAFDSPQFGKSYIPQLSRKRWDEMKDFSVQSESSRGYYFAAKTGLIGTILITTFLYFSSRHIEAIKMIAAFVGFYIISYLIGITIANIIGLFGNTAKYKSEFDEKIEEIAKNTISITNSTQTA